MWWTLAGYSNSPADVALETMVLPPGAAIYLVKPWQLHVCRVDKIVVAYWTVPLVTPAITIPPIPGLVENPISVPPITIPPGCLVLKGYGDIFPMTLGPMAAGPGWTLTFEAQNHVACGTLICPCWHYCGPIGTSEVEFTGPPNISVEGTQTFSHP